MTKSNRRIVSAEPFNAETAPAGLRRGRTPARHLFVRNHGPVPPTNASWRLQVRGSGGVDVDFDLATLRLLPTRRITMVLECAGNGRSGMRPAPPGVAWGEDAVGCVEFRGVTLNRLLRKARLGPTSGEVVVTGGDQDPNGTTFARSLPAAKAIHKDTLVAFEMNGKPLTAEHGGPVRLVVPGWFGVASIKWLRRIETTRRAFTGAYQKEHYWYRYNTHRLKDRPVTELLVKSNIVEPRADKPVRVGHHTRAWGWAWGASPVQRVDVSLDGGSTWKRAKLGPKGSQYSWREWSFNWTPGEAGAVELCVRASDSKGNSQPMEAVWNKQGYGNNAWARRTVRIKPKASTKAPRQIPNRMQARSKQADEAWTMQPSLADA